MQPTWSPHRPGRLDTAVFLVVGSVLVCLGLSIVMGVKLATYGFESVFDASIALLVPVLIWLFILVVGLVRGRRWTRAAMLFAFPLQVPLYALFAIMLTPMVLDTIYIGALGTTGETLRTWALLLCLAGLLLAVVTPLLILGPDVQAYLERPSGG